ncbi:hypothetical protein V4Z64_005173 [Pseudomonas aeruginosa]|uniref:hypothetical protein n=1 Tax=Pseudomonas aeruginosa TaxID=287 RepID=UPI000F53F8FD|nr:hypothetical protein [Pseudomonas aeruginosa]MBA5106112.1 hypothetical protein [Pseudomonas aeruginosa]MDP5990047.1 hypothetical protein [Pseudomonas aeruginosa]HCE9175765.1 hypothetical protein [Pseudomonas aeruginosa]HEJ9772024.1 hypothetical protein [Pseudomonas aeruginosa]HEO1611804.1 hypothetical protein [Pseudomonas aeruginosa]
MSYRSSRSVSAGNGALIAVVSLAVFGSLGYAASKVRKALRTKSPTPQAEDPLVCDACQGSVWPEDSLAFRGVRIEGLDIPSGIACCEGCLSNLRQSAASVIRGCQAVRVHSISYQGKRRPPIRLNRQISTGLFRNGPSAEKELLVIAAEFGCTQINDRDIHEQIENGKLWYWASGLI